MSEYEDNTQYFGEDSARESSEAMTMLYGGRQFGKCSLRHWYLKYVNHKNSYFNRVDRNTRFGKSKVFNRMVKLSMGCK